MYDINLKNIKKGNSTFIFVLVIGVIFFSIGVFMFVSQLMDFKRMDAQVEAHFVKINSHRSDDSTMYNPVHYYNVDGVEYTCSGNASSSSVTSKMNDKTVYFNSNDPSDCMTDYSKSSNNLFFIVFSILGGIAIVISICNFVKTSKRIKVVKYLNQNGKLVKNLPYRMENTNVKYNNRIIARPVVDYRLPNGSIVKLKGEGRYDFKYRDDDGFVDLLIDPNDFNLYFVDFEINRLNGNLASDYYKPTQEELSQMKNNNPDVAQFNNKNYNN